MNDLTIAADPDGPSASRAALDRSALERLLEELIRCDAQGDPNVDALFAGAFDLDRTAAAEPFTSSEDALRRLRERRFPRWFHVATLRPDASAQVRPRPFGPEDHWSKAGFGPTMALALAVAMVLAEIDRAEARPQMFIWGFEGIEDGEAG